MQFSKNINKILSQIYESTNPISIFLYGSRSQNNFNADSDYEIGVLYSKDKKISRLELNQHNIKNLKIYPFVYEDLLNHQIDTPFPKAIYLKTLIETSKTIFGQDISTITKSPEIKEIDLIESISFSLGRAYCAIISSRQNDWTSVNENFFKSLIFGLQVLIFLKTKEFLFSYQQILEKSKTLKLEKQKYYDLINQAIKVRGGESVDTKFLYTNISFLNSVLEKVSLSSKVHRSPVEGSDLEGFCFSEI